MKKLTAAFKQLVQAIRQKWISQTRILLTVLLIVATLFHELVLEKFDNWITQPILSTIKSGQFSDWFWSVFLMSTILSIINIRSRRFFYSRYWFPAGILFLITFMYFRWTGDRYTFASFKHWQHIKYADVFAFVVAIFAFSYFPKQKSKPLETNDAELKQIQVMMQSYLSMDTNYALLLNGRRGTGKTHFVKNKLLTQISRTKLDLIANENYIPVYISLFGLKSVDEIYAQLSLGLRPYLSRADVPSDSYLAKLILRGMLNITRVGNLDDYLKDLKVSQKNSINIGSFVIIFDDIDRISKDLPISELIGFINTMVEHENNKVIIVADEDAITDQDLYKEVREKTIGSVVEYPDNFETAYDEIIQVKYQITATDFHKHLETAKPAICSAFKIAGCVSLRTLIYFLNHYKKIFESLDTQQEKEWRDQEIQRRKIALSLKFTCAAIIEFKNGRISYHTKNGLDDLARINKNLQNDFTKQMYRNNTKKSAEPELETLPIEEMGFCEQFVTKFFDTWEYRFLKSIYDFVTGGNELDIKLLQSELSFIDDEVFNPTPAEQVYNQLSVPYVFDLSNEEYNTFSKQMFEYAENGEYPLKRYLNIFATLLRYPEIAEYRSEVLVKSLVNAIKRNQLKYSYDSTLDFTLRVESEEFRHPDWQTLKDAIREVNNATEALKEERRTENLYGLFLSDPEGFYKRCESDFSDRQVFHSWDFPTFYQDFLRLKSSAIPSFTWFLRARYKYAGNADWIEKPFLEALLNALSFDDGEELNLRKIVINELIETISGIHKNYTRIGLEQKKP